MLVDNIFALQRTRIARGADSIVMRGFASNPHYARADCEPLLTTLSGSRREHSTAVLRIFIGRVALISVRTP